MAETVSSSIPSMSAVQKHAQGEKRRGRPDVDDPRARRRAKITARLEEIRPEIEPLTEENRRQPAPGTTPPSCLRHLAGIRLRRSGVGRPSSPSRTRRLPPAEPLPEFAGDELTA